MVRRARPDQPAPVLILDDGELEDVHEILLDLGFSCERLRGGAIADDTMPPSALLVSTPRRIGAVEPSTSRLPLRVVVVNEDSPALREQLRGYGFDYLVRRPVHAEALRLLLLHCLYSGEERRKDVRMPVGLEVSFGAGSLPRGATLVDLSSSGCRILSHYALEPGTRIKVDLPKKEAGETLTLAGRVLRIHLDERQRGDGLYSTAIFFNVASEEERVELEEILQNKLINRIIEAPQRAIETTRTSAADPNHPDVSQRFAVAGEFSSEDNEERRKARRAAYSAKVAAFGDPALRVLVGRDLSVGGMRVEPHPDISLGDRLHLAIYGDAADDPIAIWATVSRDDGDTGLLMMFDAVHPDVATELEALVANLPAIESLHDTETGAMGTVISQVLD